MQRTVINMQRFGLWLLMILLGLIGSHTPWTWAQERPGKIKMASAVKLSPVYYLPVLAAEERGLWKQQGLQVEWFPFESGSAMYQAAAAGEIQMGETIVSAEFQAVARGVPVIIVSDLHPSDNFSFWVSTKGQLQTPAGLKGAKVGVSRFGGTEHAYGRAVAKALRLDQEVKFVSTGGISQSIAGLKTQAVDALVLTPHQMLNLQLAGEVKVLLNVDDYLPSPWSAYVIFAHKEFAKKFPETVKKMVRVNLQAIEFITKNPQWTMDKMMAMSNYSREAAKLVFADLKFSKDGRLDRKALENVRTFLIDYEISPKDKTPPVDAMFTTQFLP